MKDMNRNRSSDESRSTTKNKSFTYLILFYPKSSLHSPKTWGTLVFYATPANGMKILGV
jgi:hypothetical protein